MEPFFDRYPDGEMRADSVDFHPENAARVQPGWKLLIFLVGVAVTSAVVSLAAGGAPPLSWRQSAVWNTLSLPGAASPQPPPAAIRR
jgi:hypothetical protein